MMGSLEIIASCDLDFGFYSKLNDLIFNKALYVLCLLLGPDIR